MAQAFLITLREGLEAALIVGIVLAVLARAGRRDAFAAIWWGVAGAVLVSIIGGGLLFALGLALKGPAEEIFEGTAMLLAVGVLTWMIMWMRRQARYIRSELERQVRQAVATGSTVGLSSLAFVAVSREGLETALFLFAAVKTATPLATTVGGTLGLGLAGVLGYAIYRGSSRLNLRAFFTTTGVLLILFAAGLLAHGLNELQEAGLLPVVVEHVWDTNNVLDESAGLGAFLKSILGYNGNPSLLEIIAYPTYLALALLYLLRPLPATSTAGRLAG